MVYQKHSGDLAKGVDFDRIISPLHFALKSVAVSPKRCTFAPGVALFSFERKPHLFAEVAQALIVLRF